MSGKKFRFSLESVLRLREHETRMAQDELSSARARKRQQEEIIVEAHHRLGEVLQGGPTGRVDQATIRQFDSHRQAAQTKLEDARRQLRHLHLLEEEAHARLLEKRAAEESLRKLQEEEARRHRESVEAAENAFLDEQALTSYHRQKTSTYR